jgi:type IV secretory pathway component VirB8
MNRMATTPTRRRWQTRRRRTFTVSLSEVIVWGVITALTIVMLLACLLLIAMR